MGDGHPQLHVVGVLDGHHLQAPAVLLDLGIAEIAADAVVDVDDEVAGVQLLGAFDALALARDGGCRATAHGTLANPVDVGLAQNDEAEVRPFATA